eukprot:TRINITY_DN7294_c0_g1_i4.p1 TRINITY_DN7294_c0_g1~~TRINITY_DN7294_c0_g1_i4.p1  ORF type:complete len:808 (+),score=322.30 TRINITY_DN7294_c0_g1_i4:40-2463(+)
MAEGRRMSTGAGHSTTTITLKAVQMLMSELPDEVDAQSLKPKIGVDAEALTSAVAALYKALRQQATVLEVLEKEGSKRKMEYDITTRNLRNDLESVLDQEAKRRAAEDDKLRIELARLRADMEQRNDDVRMRLRETESDMHRLIEKTNTQLRGTLGEHAQRANQLHEELNVQAARHRDLTQKVQDNAATAETQRRRLGSDLDVVFQLLSVSRDEAAGACRGSKQKDLLLQTPVFRSLSAADRDLDAKIESLLKQMARTEKTLSVFEGRAQAVDRAVEVQKAALDDSKQDLLRRMSENHRIAMARSQDLDERKVDRQVVEEKASKVDVSFVSGRVSDIEVKVIDSNKQGREEREALARELQRKADWESLADKLDKEDGESQLKTMCAKLEELRDEVSELRDAVSRARVDPIRTQRRRSPQMDDTPPADPSDAPGGATVDAALLDGLAEKLAGIDQDLVSLERDKVSRLEMDDLLVELRNAAAQGGGGGGGGDRPGRDPGGDIVAEDGTALRFRCLSCNRVAGSLFEQPRDRAAANRQFPPSTMFLSSRGEKSPRAGARPASPRGSGGQAGHAVTLDPHAVSGKLGIRPPDWPSGSGDRKTPPKSRPHSPTPGGGTVSTTRKKLMNYYDWLRGRSDEIQNVRMAAEASRGPTPTGDSPRAAARGGRPAVAWGQDAPGSPQGGERRSPSPPGRWDGAQSGGGEPRTRQSGDHGSRAPHSIGTDGRFYAGVNREEAREREKYFREAMHAQTQREEGEQKADAKKPAAAARPDEEIPSRPTSAADRRGKVAVVTAAVSGGTSAATKKSAKRQ